MWEQFLLWLPNQGANPPVTLESVWEGDIGGEGRGGEVKACFSFLNYTSHKMFLKLNEV